MPEISMLAQIDITVVDDTPVIFSLEYITREGEYRFYAKLAKNFKPATEAAAKKTERSNNYRVKEKGVLRVFDFQANHDRTLLIDGIISYNQMQVV